MSTGQVQPPPGAPERADAPAPPTLAYAPPGRGMSVQDRAAHVVMASFWFVCTLIVTGGALLMSMQRGRGTPGWQRFLLGSVPIIFLAIAVAMALAGVRELMSAVRGRGPAEGEQAPEERG